MGSLLLLRPVCVAPVPCVVTASRVVGSEASAPARPRGRVVSSATVTAGRETLAPARSRCGKGVARSIVSLVWARFQTQSPPADWRAARRLLLRDRAAGAAVLGWLYPPDAWIHLTSSRATFPPTWCPQGSVVLPQSRAVQCPAAGVLVQWSHPEHTTSSTEICQQVSLFGYHSAGHRPVEGVRSVGQQDLHSEVP